MISELCDLNCVAGKEFAREVFLIFVSTFKLSNSLTVHSQIAIFVWQVVVLHVGTNNFGDPPEHISDGIVEIINVIRERHPETYIVFIVSIKLEKIVSL